MGAARPLGILSLSDHIRANAPATIAYFVEQGVTLNVISGDDPRTVAGIAAEAGVPDADKWVDASTLTTPEAGRFFHEKFGLGASPQDVVRMVGEYMMEFYSTRAKARPGALAFVRALFERGVRLSVASSSPMPYLLAGLSHTNFLPLFDAVVSVDDVGKPKREPAVYDRARHLMGTDLSLTWGVEDALYAIGTLKRAGYHTLAVYDCDMSGTYEALAFAAERVVRDFRELDPDGFVEIARMVARS